MGYGMLPRAGSQTLLLSGWLALTGRSNRDRSARLQPSLPSTPAVATPTQPPLPTLQTPASILANRRHAGFCREDPEEIRGQFHKTQLISVPSAAGPEPQRLRRCGFLTRRRGTSQAVNKSDKGLLSNLEPQRWGNIAAPPGGPRPHSHAEERDGKRFKRMEGRSRGGGLERKRREKMRAMICGRELLVMECVSVPFLETTSVC